MQEKGYVTADVAEAEGLHQLKLSGTKFRKMLRAGEDIPEWCGTCVPLRLALLQRLDRMPYSTAARHSTLYFPDIVLGFGACHRPLCTFLTLFWVWVHAIDHSVLS